MARRWHRAAHPGTGDGPSPGLCYCWREHGPGSYARWVCLLNHVLLLWLSPRPPHQVGTLVRLRWCWREVQRRCGQPCAQPALYQRGRGHGSESLRQAGAPLYRCWRGGGDRVGPQVARGVGMASSRYQVQKALRAGTSVCSSGCQFRAPAAALAQLSGRSSSSSTVLPTVS